MNSALRSTRRCTSFDKRVCHKIKIKTIYRYLSDSPRWLPLEPLRHCLSHTGCKLILLDPERADRLAPAVFDILRDRQVTDFLVFDDQGNEHVWQGMTSFHRALQKYAGSTADILAVDPQIMPEDNATIMFTSGAPSQHSTINSRQQIYPD